MGFRSKGAFTHVARLAAMALAVGTAFATASAAEASTATEHVRIEYIQKHFASCRAAQEYYAKGVPAGLAYIRLDTKFTRPVAWYTGGDFWEAKAYGTIDIDYRTSVLIVDVPAWKHMTKADKANAKYLVEALKEHEEGHEKVARDLLAYYRHYPFGGGGTSEQAAVNSVLDQEPRFEPTVQKALNDHQERYDAVTQHGTRQHLIGGKDTLLACGR